MGTLQDIETSAKQKAVRNLQKAKAFENKCKMYTYTAPNGLVISHQTKEGLERVKKTLGFKD